MRIARHPGIHLERLVRDVYEAVALEPGDRPVASALLRLGARLSRADFGGDAFDEIPGIAILRQRRIGGRGDGIGLRHHRGGDCGEEGGGEHGGSGHARFAIGH